MIEASPCGFTRHFIP